MEALLALREAIVHGGAITEQAETLSAVDANGDTLVLSKAVKTPFKMASGGHFTLEALWMQYLCKYVFSDYELDFLLAQVAPSCTIG